MKKGLTVLKKIMNIICWLLVIFLVAVVIFSFVSRITNSSPTFLGYSFYRVSSASMEPELMVGDVILDKSVENPKELKVGDVITFDGNNDTGGVPITHKIIKAPYKDIDGVWRLQTKGVANDTPDEEITLDNVKSIMVCKVPFLTQVYKIFLSPWGLLIFIALLIFIFIDEIITIIKIVTGNYDTEDKEDIGEIIDRLKKEKKLESVESTVENAEEKTENERI